MYPTVPHLAMSHPAAGRGGSKGKGAMQGGKEQTSQPGSTLESDICQTPMLLLIKSGGQLAACRHPYFPHLPAAGAKPCSSALEPLPCIPPVLSGQLKLREAKCLLSLSDLAGHRAVRKRAQTLF